MNQFSRLFDKFRTALVSEVLGVIVAAGLLLTLARLLDTEAYGILFLAISVLSLIRELSQFGMTRAAARYVTEFKESDPERVSDVIIVSSVYLTILLSLSSVILFFGAESIASLIGESELTEFFVYGGVFIIVSTGNILARQVLQAFELIKPASYLSIADRSMRFVFSVALVVFGFGAIGAFLGHIISYLISSLLGLGYVIRHLREHYSVDTLDDRAWKEVGKYSLPVAVTQSAHTVDNYVDKILIGFFVGPTPVAFYTVSKQIVRFIETPMSALGFTLSPAYSSQKAKGEVGKARRLYEESFSKSLLLYAPAGAGVVALAEPAIRIALGTDYVGATRILQIFSVFIVLQSTMYITNHGLDYLGRAKHRAIVKVVTAGLNLVLNVALIPIYGAVGAAIATVVTYSIYTVANVYLMHLELRLHAFALLKALGSALSLGGLVYLAIYPFLAQVTGVLTLVGVVGIGLVVWLTMVLLFDLGEMRSVVKFVVRENLR